ncbi:type I-C CRISPR-associated protein Cas8c/Csd1 [Sinimarinibacterium flocculans]|uniref:CRISPR-associated Csd1 family protein n=1 Tax=Sinimarinibacterium flocculans TaxID=985250 RepID=A0A318E962_9GAMM|nr:type I-C CRISPR-associated protein Cas8c/Csd1 [Sinimarinibacterium flocculans]PXV67838.1 CRISPR-associated Csd1 family protein [Sinimarinibacterium flocculans]HBG31914.1 type I-C CRISPR-associated protein Cas8c/Csd1 [Gammaproteobacteria bacterium]
MILAALNDYYLRLLDEQPESISAPGYSQEKISYAIILSPGGDVIDVLDIRDTSGKKPTPRGLSVPQAPKRSVNIAACFLWDKTSYVLGVSASSKRSEQEHATFRALHAEALADTDDPGLRALQTFLSQWRPKMFTEHPAFVRHGETMLDTNVVFRLEGEQRFLHERPAARAAWQRMVAAGAGSALRMCLVTGEKAPVARLHPAIKGVMGAQSSGASLVSFNLESFTSYGKQQGENAPISEAVAFAYTTVLNHLLRRESRQQLRIGDTTVVFWAQAPSNAQAQAAEDLFASFFDPADDDERAIRQLYEVLDQVRRGLPLRDLEGQLDDGTRIFVLGLAPNASRLSVRFWETETLAVFAERLAWHFDDLNLVPSPWRRPPPVWRLLLASAPSRDGKAKSEDVPPQLAGELTRAILTGGRYPRSLLTTLIMRLRADGDERAFGARASLIKAILAREARLGQRDIDKGVLPVSLDTENADPGYLLGRLFSTLENIQRAALGKQINATIRDRYYGAASATPASVFPVLLRNAQHHLGRLRKDKPGFAVNLEKEIGEIVDRLGTAFPRSLRIEAQGQFAIGYYHQIQARFARHDVADTETEGEIA